MITTYKIKRNHGNKTKFFIVNVKEVRQYGVGFQINLKGIVYGISLTKQQ